jgi:hypothetical protein
MIVLIYIVLNLVIVLRLITYMPGEASYKWHISLAAYLLTISSGAQVVNVALHSATVSVWDVINAAILCVLVLRAGGNISRIVKLES